MRSLFGECSVATECNREHSVVAPESPRRGSAQRTVGTLYYAAPRCENDTGGPIHNSALRRFTGQRTRNRRGCNVLRPGGPVVRCRTGRYGRGGSDPPPRGLGAA